MNTGYANLLGDEQQITEASVLRDALLAFAKTTVGRERAIAESLAARAEELAEAVAY
jgi:hypothetical protein